MVLYFTSNVVKPAAYIYMGKDKFENEDLIKFGWEEDVWFHVDNLSSAHVYLRLPEGETWDKINPELLMDCAQLTKANSIQGNKKNNITVIYTPWANLKKDGSMDTGAVAFHNPKDVKRVHVETRENTIVNRLNKTKVVKQPDLRQEQDEHRREKERAEKMIKNRAKEKPAKPQPKPEKGYGEWNDEEALQASSNQDRDADFLDDFF